MNTIGLNTGIQALSQKSYLTPKNKKVNLINLEALKVSSKILAPFTQELLAPKFSENFQKASQQIKAKQPYKVSRIKKEESLNTLQKLIHVHCPYIEKDIQNLIKKYPDEMQPVITKLTNYLKNLSVPPQCYQFESILRTEIGDVFKTKIFQLLKQNPKDLHLFQEILNHWCKDENHIQYEVWELLKANPNQIPSCENILKIYIKTNLDLKTKVFEFIEKNPDKLESFPRILGIYTQMQDTIFFVDDRIFELLKQNPVQMKHPEYKLLLSKQKRKDPQLFLELIKENYENCNEGVLDAFISVIFNNPSLDLQTLGSKKELISAFLKHISGFPDEQKKMFFNCKNPLIMFLESPSRLEFEKTDSELSLSHFPNFGTIITNTIPKTSFQVWKNIHNKGDIPVAPILWTEESTDRKIAVHSRYCGINLFDLNKRYGKSLSELVKLADARTQEIIRTLDSIQVKHGHIHDGNFTVEFIDKDCLKKRFELGETINTIEYDPENFSFDPEVYTQNTNKWKMVVRLIDWDQARQISL